MLSAVTTTNSTMSINMLECKTQTLLTHYHIHNAQTVPSTEKKLDTCPNKLLCNNHSNNFHIYYCIYDSL